MPDLKSMEAAKRGWEIFMRSDFRTSRSAINRELVAAGLPEISERMHTHYRRLVRYGCTEYIPINRMDVSLKDRKRHAA